MRGADRNEGLERRVDTDGDAALVAELEEDNRRLRRLLDQHDAPGELRHRLRTTLALLRRIIRRSAVTERERDGYIGQLEDRLDAITRAQATADAHGEIDLHALVADELFHYGVSEGDRLRITGPVLRFTPTSGQVFSLALHELAVNAVEHGAIGARGGRVEVAWSVADNQEEPVLEFGWQESGAEIDGDAPHRGFGTEVLTRMLAYELQAETRLALERTGFRCTIRFPVPPKVGRVDRC